MNQKRLIIIGAGGHGKICGDIALKMGDWQEIAFLDDDPTIKYSIGFPVIGKKDEFKKYANEYDIFVAVGTNKMRAEIIGKLEEQGINIPTLIHPDATLGHGVSIGAGTVVSAGTVINPCVNIGQGCIINTGSTIDHDCVIGDYVHVSPGVNIAGSVSIGSFSWLGVGSVVSNNVIITGGCTIGAGAVVVTDISQQGTYVGIPAKRV